MNDFKAFQKRFRRGVKRIAYLDREIGIIDDGIERSFAELRDYGF